MFTVVAYFSQHPLVMGWKHPLVVSYDFVIVHWPTRCLFEQKLIPNLYCGMSSFSSKCSFPDTMAVLVSGKGEQSKWREICTFTVMYGIWSKKPGGSQDGTDHCLCITELRSSAHGPKSFGTGWHCCEDFIWERGSRMWSMMVPMDRALLLIEFI